VRRSGAVIILVVGAALSAGKGVFVPAPRADAENHGTSDLKRLEAERVEVLKQLLQVLTTQYERGSMDFREVCAAHLDLTNAKLDLANTPEARSTLLKEASRTAEELSQIARGRLQLADEKHLDALRAQAVCLNIQIRLAEQSSDAAELSRLRAERIKVLRVAAQIVDTQFERGTAEVDALCDVYRSLTDAELALAKTPEERIRLLAAQLQVVRRLLKTARLRTGVGATDSLAASLIEALCLETDIRLAEQQNDPARAKKLRAERAQAMKRVAAILGTKTQNGLVNSFAFSVAQVNLLDAQVELAETPSERIALWEEQKALLKRLLEIVTALAGTGQGRPWDVAWTKAVYLDTQVKILQERNERNGRTK
jgi:cytochrome c556